MESMIRRTCDFYNKYFPGCIEFYPVSEGAVESTYLDLNSLVGFTYMGNVTRSTRYKLVDVNINSVLEPFLRTHNPDFHQTHANCQPNFDSGYAGAMKFNKLPPHDIDEEALDIVEGWMNLHFYQGLIGCQPYRWDDVFTNLNKQASTGFPLNNTKFKTKGSILLYEYVSHFLNEYEAMAFTLMHFVCFWQVSQKYEMRSFKKVYASPQDIRVFLSGPFDHVCLTNRWCLDFNERFKNLSETTFSKVGMTKYYRGWDKLYNKLRKHIRGFSLDCTGFDTCVFFRLYAIIIRFRHRCFTEDLDKDKIMRVLQFIYQAIIYGCLVLEKGDLVWKMMGNTSGQGNTLVDNTLVSFILIGYAYVVLAGLYKYPASYSTFVSDLELALVGDDNTASVDSEIMYFFNYHNISQVFNSLGFKVTCDYPDFAPICDLEFLSHKFLIQDRFVYPLPDVNKMFSSLFYGDGSNDPRWVFMRVCAFRMEVYPHKGFFKMCNQIIEYLLHNYSNDLVGIVKMNNGQNAISWESIKSLNFTSQQLENIYRGVESYFDHNQLLLLNSVCLNN